MSDVYTKSLLDYYSHLNGLSVNDPKYSDQAAQEAQEKYENYINSLKGGIPQDAKDAIAKYLQIYADPSGAIVPDGAFGPSGDNSWAGQDKDKDVAGQIEFMAFMNENYGWETDPEDANGVNPLTASLFALMGLKTWDNTDCDSNYKMTVPSTSVFQSIINKFQGGMSQDDLNFTLGNLESPEDQEKLVSVHRKIQPLVEFANHVVSIINWMESWCRGAGLSKGSDWCYYICYQTGTSGGNQRVYAQSGWSRHELETERKKYVYNDFGISGSDFAKQVSDFLNAFNSISP
jgi:hypothetical protein